MVRLNLSEFLKPEDVAPKAKLRIIDSGQMATFQPDDGETREVFQIGVKLPSGDVKQWSMNKTSQRTVGGVWGADTDDWVGKEVEVEVITQMIRGKKKEVVYAKAPPKVVDEETVSN